MKYKSKENKIKLLLNFIYFNKKKCLNIINNKEYRLKLNINPINKKDVQKVNLKVLDDLLTLEQMFYKCGSLISLSEISSLKFHKIKNINKLFFGCSLLESLPDLSKFDIKNMTSLNSLFSGCSSLLSLPDIFKMGN